MSDPTEPEAPRYIETQELSAEGYIGEANRRFFHPLGLALEWTPGLSEDQIDKLIAAEGLTTNNEIIGAKTIIAALGLDRPHLSGVWDSRDDPEGISYGGEYTPAMARARQHVDELWVAREPARVAALGYMVQPVGETFDMAPDYMGHQEPPSPGATFES